MLMQCVSSPFSSQYYITLFQKKNKTKKTSSIISIGLNTLPPFNWINDVYMQQHVNRNENQQYHDEKYPRLLVASV